MPFPPGAHRPLLIGRCRWLPVGWAQSRKGLRVALLTVDFFAETLEVGTSMMIVLPQVTAEQVGVEAAGVVTDFPVLYLLHGMSDDHTAWVRYTSVERYAAERGLAVVMPAVHRSFYANERHGHAYWDFVSDELPRIVGNFVKVTADPARTYVAGLSMGGYGALKLALNFPDRFAAAASLSGALDLRWLMERPERREEVSGRIFGGDLDATEDLMALVERGQAPPLLIGCGTEDRLYDGNVAFAERARAVGLDVTTDFRIGDHEWSLWDAQLPRVMDFVMGAGQ